MDGRTIDRLRYKIYIPSFSKEKSGYKNYLLSVLKRTGSKCMLKLMDKKVFTILHSNYIFVLYINST